MEEKKLTDEETVKAIKDCLKDKVPCDKCKVYNKNKPMLSERFIICKKLIKNLYDLIRRQKAEIERLTAQINQRREMMHRMDCNYATELQKNAELQKQVDELKERYLEESKERCEFEQKYKKIQHVHNIGLGVQRSQWEKKVEQAEKDTAKEIFEAIFNDCWAIKDENGQRIFVESIIRHTAKEKYGVEVE